MGVGSYLRAIKSYLARVTKKKEKKERKPTPKWGKWEMVCKLGDLEPRRYKNCRGVKI